jgi:hypothetical protein
MATYLTIVNDVMRRMREDTVSSVATSTYSTMIGDFVNDAKDIVEQAWNWTALRSSISINTTQSTYNYSLTGSSDRFTDLGAYNTTTPLRLLPRPSQWLDKEQQTNTAPEGTPAYYTFRGVDASGDLTVDVHPVPDGVYALKFNGVLPQATLSANADILSVPVQPVRQLALAMAVRERGETGGISAQEHFALAEQYLSDAIAYDATLNGEETVWRPV